MRRFDFAFAFLPGRRVVASGGRPHTGGVCSDVLHDTKDAVFHRALEPPIRRSLTLKNNFPFGLAVWNVSLPSAAGAYLRVSRRRQQLRRRRLCVLRLASQRAPPSGGYTSPSDRNCAGRVESDDCARLYSASAGQLHDLLHRAYKRYKA